MKKRVIFFTCFILLSCAGFAQDTTRTAVYFAASSAELGSQSIGLLDSLCTALKMQKGAIIRLSGHTDSRGSAGANDTLSRRRVNIVRQYLTQCGLKGVHLSTEAEGEMQPVADNTSHNGMAQNRRVEIEVFEPAPEPSIEDAQLEALLTCMRPGVQKFRMRCDTVQEIVAENGTVIVVPGGTFPCSDSLDLEVMEAYDKASILALKLTTVSGGGLLESGGMVHLRALNGGSEIKPRNGKGMMVLMPAGSAEKKMSTFYSEQDKHGNIVWPSKGEISGTRQQDGSWGWIPRPYEMHYDILSRKGYKKMIWSIGNAFRSAEKREKNQYTGDSRVVPKRWLVTADVRRGVSYQRVFRSGKADANGNYNSLYVQRTGWVNCDFFYHSGKPLLPQVTMINEKGNSVAVLFFNKHNVVIRAETGRGKNYFYNVPKGEEVTLVAYRKGVNGLEVALRETSVSERITDLEFRTMSAEELKTIVNKIGVSPLGNL
jgi:hypothetical protein